MTRRKFTIVQKGLLLIALPVLSQLVLLAFLFQLQYDTAEASKAARHSKEVLMALDEAFRHLAQAQSEMRGFVLTANPVFDSKSGGPMQQSIDSLDTLYILVSDNAPQQHRIIKMRAGAVSFQQWAERIRVLVREGHQSEAVAAVSDLSGKTLLDGVETQLQEFRAEEQRLDKQRIQQVDHTRGQQRLTLIIATAGTLGIAIAVVILFTQGVSSRLKILADNASRLVGGQSLAEPVDGNDEIAELDAVLHDSANKLSESARVAQRYREEIEARAAELGRVNQQLTQKTQENEMFVYSVSHDLRSPLVNLQGFGKELARSCEDLRKLLGDTELPASLRAKLLVVVDQDMPDSLRFIQSAVTRSANIIDAMLRLSRVGRLEYRRQRVPIGDIVQRVVDSVASTASEKGATLNVGELPDAWGDDTALEQTFANLIVNALNYLDPKRSGQIEIGSLPPASDSPHGRVTYYVKDNGLGIPEAYLHKMFVAFQRLHGDVAKGEGIGLALVRRIVQRHGGQIWVDSKENVGSTFFVSLPGTEATLQNEKLIEV